MSTKFLSPGWRMPRNANQGKNTNYSMFGTSSQKIDASNVPLGSESWTIAVWYKQSNSASNYIFWDMQYGSAGGLKLIQQGGTGGGTTYAYFLAYGPQYFNFQSQKVITEDNWHHVIVRYNKNVDYRIYVDGILSGITTNKNTYSWPATRNLELFKTVVDVHLDQFCVFDYALSDTSTTVGDTATGQIATLWGGGTAVSNPMALPSPPKVYYPLGKSTWNGNFLSENNAIGDYVFDFIPNDYIDCGTGLGDSLGTYTGDLTLSYWFNTDSLTANKGLFYIGSFSNAQGQFQVNIYNNNMLFRVDSGNQSKALSISSLSTGTWYHIGFIYKAGNISDSKVYLNGVEQSTTDTGTFPSSLSFSGLKTIIGGYYGTNNTFDGKLSNVQVFNTALPATGSNSVETLYNNGSPLTSMSGFTSLVSWWKLNASDTYDSSTGNWTIEDHAGSNDGTSSGMSQSNLVQSNLQTVAPYSKYAMNFDGTDYINCNTSLNGINSITYSAWIKPQAPPGSFANIISSGDYQPNERMLALGVRASNQKIFVYGGNSAGGIIDFNFTVTYGTWYHIAIVYTNNQDVDLYVNGNAEGSIQFSNTTSIASGTATRIGAYSGTLQNYFNGIISNVSIWNAALTQTQIREIYNEGLPSDLNSHSAYSNLLSWWQLGENSSYVSGATNPWTFADEMPAGNNATSGNLPETALTDGVGTTANGVSTGMSEGSLIGDAPYSTANAISKGMAVTARGTDVP